MSYKTDFENADGWSAVDVSVRLNNANGRKFLSFLRQNGVDVVIRYYASSPLAKTLTAEEARLLSAEGFAILPVFQDRARRLEDFSTEKGLANAHSAKEFAARIGQPAGAGSTILFAADADFSDAAIDGPISDYFRAIHREIGDAFRIGAYGSGALLSKLLAEGLIDVPWLSMSRAFGGTQPFFYANQWALRQLPPEREHAPSGIGYDADVIRIDRRTLGAFQIAANGDGHLAFDEGLAATLGSLRAFREEIAPEGNRLLVKTEGLRLRQSPNGIVIRDLTIADEVVALAPASADGWREVQVGREQGFVFDSYLRPPGHPAIERLLRVAVDEWLRFDKGEGSEKADPYCGYVRQMWAALGQPHDGRSKDANGDDIPWSAAFISFVVRQAGAAYGAFQFSSMHSVFVNNAIKARVTGRLDKPFWGYRINEQRPEPGDIIQRNRSGGTVTFSHAENHASYKSHADFVLEVTPDVVRVLGGNVGNTVAYGTSGQEYELTPDGFIEPGQGVIALLKNRTGVAGA